MRDYRNREILPLLSLFCMVFAVAFPSAPLGNEALAQEGLSPASRAVEDVEWRLSEIVGMCAAPGDAAEMPSFALESASRNVRGFTGCNRFHADYALDGASLRFGPIASTRRACPDTVQALETRFLAALARVRRWEIKDEELLLSDDTAPLLRFAVNAGNEPEIDLSSLAVRSTVISLDSVTLTKGVYRAPAAPGSASEIVIALTDARAFGALNGADVGAVVLSTETGGTGVFFELALLFRRNDEWLNTDTALLGDRVKVHSVAIEDGSIVVTMTTHAPGDPMCCPTLEAEKRFTVVDDRLVAVTGGKRRE